MHVRLQLGRESRTVQLGQGIVAELNEKGDFIGLEIQDASSFIRDCILESVQGQLLQARDQDTA